MKTAEWLKHWHQSVVREIGTDDIAVLMAHHQAAHDLLDFAYWIKGRMDSPPSPHMMENMAKNLINKYQGRFIPIPDRPTDDPWQRVWKDTVEAAHKLGWTDVDVWLAIRLGFRAYEDAQKAGAKFPHQ